MVRAVDDELDRRDYLRIVTTASVGLLGAGAAAKPGWEWYSDRDNRINSDKLEKKVEGQQDRFTGISIYWGYTRDIQFDTDAITATIEPTGEQTDKGGRLFTARIDAPVTDESDELDDLLYYAASDAGERELRDALFESHEVLFDILYDTTGQFRAPGRRPEEDRIVSYTTEIADDSARTQVTVDAETAHSIAQGGFLQPAEDYNPANNKAERQRFQEAYNDEFMLATHGPDRIDTEDAERTIEKQLQAANQDAYEHIVVGGITASLNPDADGDGSTYTATVSAPIGSWSSIDICQYVDDELETELAGDLAHDMEKLFTEVYNQLSQYATQVRGSEQDDISTYRVVATDDSGQAQAGIDAGTAAWIARGYNKPSTYKPENGEEHARFRQAYFDAFEAVCDEN